MSIFTDIVEMFDQLDEVQQYMNGNVKDLVARVDGKWLEGAETYNVKMYTKHRDALKSALRILVTRMTNDPSLDLVEAADLFSRAERLRLRYHRAISEAFAAYLGGHEPRQPINFDGVYRLVNDYFVRKIGQSPVNHDGTLVSTLDMIEAELGVNFFSVFTIYHRSLDLHPNWGQGRRMQQLRQAHPDISLMAVRMVIEIYEKHWPLIGPTPTGEAPSLGQLLRAHLSAREPESATHS